jgi:hypothetical protein
MMMNLPLIPEQEAKPLSLMKTAVVKDGNGITI